MFMIKTDENRIKIIPHSQSIDFSTLISLDLKRDWFDNHMYRCLPLSIANQYGFAFKSPYDMWIEWNGGEDREDLKFEVFNVSDEEYNRSPLYPNSSFGRGIITFYPRFNLKTSPLINTWVKAPSNNPKHGLSWLEGIVETDNLEGTFSFNLKLTKPYEKVYIKKGELLVAFAPIPRFFIEKYRVEVSYDSDEVIENKKNMVTFEKVRGEESRTGKSNQYYMRGKTAKGCPFAHEHQRVVKKDDIIK